MYKNVSFLAGIKADPWDLLYRAIDWVEEQGILVPTTVIFKNTLADIETYGMFRPKTERIYLYRKGYKNMELALVHELVHAWQWDGDGFLQHEPFILDISPSGKRARYLLEPVEVEAYWYQNEYSKRYYSEELSPWAEEYRNLGVHLSHLSVE